jgi:hypothetical protein
MVYMSVPLTWDENALQQMRACMVKAGLVSGEGALESSIFVRAPEAASFHCHQLSMSSLHERDKVLMVDVGGRTVDVVVQEVVRSGNNFKVQELTAPSTGRCGGTYIC